MRFQLPLFVTLAVATPARQFFERDSIKVQQFEVRYSSCNGGCGACSDTLSPDRTVVTFGFDKFQTYIGPTAQQADKTKQCQIHLSLQYPRGERKRLNS
ncbi:hypothetical protein BDZ45DRAFT_737343 [Acephala macrosclerotiorum]|nr:hypothetical protein BDZ45DRAFT_737343 [Acephala macrosclerotiorum]